MDAAGLASLDAAGLASLDAAGFVALLLFSLTLALPLIVEFKPGVIHSEFALRSKKIACMAPRLRPGTAANRMPETRNHVWEVLF